MRIEHHQWFSPRLGRELGLTVFGHFGPPVVAFPTSGGNEWEYKDRGLIDAIGDFLDAGRVKVFAVSANHDDSFHNAFAHPFHRSYAQRRYAEYVREEVVPFVWDDCRSPLPLTAFGASMGGYHAANFVFKHPDVFRRCFAFSGVYDLRAFMDGQYNDDFYFNNPVDYLANLNDAAVLDQLKGCDIRLVTGSGPWEDSSTSYRVNALLTAKGLTPCVDDWGPEGGHDWPYWNRQIREYVGRLG